MSKSKAVTSRSGFRPKHTAETRQLSALALRACLVASDAAFNIKDFVVNASPIALLAVRDCEKELDRIEQEIDQQIPSAMAHVNEIEARELLACLRFSTELERIGDLLWGVGQSLQNLRVRLPKADAEQFTLMISMLEKMLQQVRQAFEERDLEPAGYVLREDREIDRVHKSFVRQHLQNEDETKMQHNAELLLIAQALERAGDHATNLAEELFRLIQGRSLRHTPKKRIKD